MSDEMRKLNCLVFLFNTALGDAEDIVGKAKECLTDKSVIVLDDIEKRLHQLKTQIARLAEQVDNELDSEVEK